MIRITIILVLYTITSLQVDAGTDQEALGPIITVEEFYKKINEKNCEGAVKLRTEYSIESCRKVHSINIKHVELSIKDAKHAVVYLDLTYKNMENKDQTKIFTGYLTLNHTQQGWIIDGNSYKSGKKDDKEEYPRKNTKFSPSPIEKISIISKNITDKNETKQHTDIIEPLLIKPKIVPTVILDALWTPEQLQGKDSDKDIIQLRPSDKRQPDQLSPRKTLSPLASERRKSIRRIEPINGEKVVALTFDLCERANHITGYDKDIVNILRREGVHATFFAGGKWMRSHQEQTMQLMADPIFEIGNHAWTHENFRVINTEMVDKQIVWTQAQYEILRDNLVTLARRNGINESEINRIPVIPEVFRFPYGTCTPQALEQVNRHGLTAIQWDVVSGDPAKNVTVKTIIHTVLRGIRPGSIVVFHANGLGKKTSDALPEIIKHLQSDGYRFVTIRELLNSGKLVTTEECYELHPGDNYRYDHIFDDEGNQ